MKIKKMKDNVAAKESEYGNQQPRICCRGREFSYWWQSYAVIY